MLMRSPRAGRVRRSMPAGARRQGARRRRLDTQAQTRRRAHHLLEPLPLRRAGGRVRPSSRLSALARGPGAERGFRPRCTTARVAALAAFGGPGLARSRQRLVAASRALPFARRQSALGHPLPQAVAARASRDDGGSPNVPALRSGVSAPRSGWPSEWVRSASSQPTGRARLLSRSFGTEQRPAGAGGLWARSRGRPAWGLSPF